MLRPIKSPIQRISRSPLTAVADIYRLVRELSIIKKGLLDQAKSAEIQIQRAARLQKGEKGDRGQKGERGEKGDKGDSIKGPKGDKGDRGDSPSIIEITNFVLEQIQVPRNGKDAIFDEKAIVDKTVKKIQEGGLTIDDIKDLEARLRNLGSKIALGGGVVKGGGGSWHQVALSGTIDGNNTTFTFTGVKPSQYSERVFLNYIEQNPVNGDYTINYETQTVTYAVAPDASLSGTPHTIRYHA